MLDVRERGFVVEIEVLVDERKTQRGIGVDREQPGEHDVGPRERLIGSDLLVQTGAIGVSELLERVLDLRVVREGALEVVRGHDRVPGAVAEGIDLAQAEEEVPSRRFTPRAQPVRPCALRTSASIMRATKCARTNLPLVRLSTGSSKLSDHRSSPPSARESWTDTRIFSRRRRSVPCPMNFAVRRVSPRRLCNHPRGLALRPGGSRSPPMQCGRTPPGGTCRRPSRVGESSGVGRPDSAGATAPSRPGPPGP